MFGAGANPASDATLTTLRVPPAARIAGRNARTQCTIPRTFTSRMRRHSRERRLQEAAQEGDASVVDEHVDRAHARCTAAASAFTDSSFATSQATAWHRAPVATISSRAVSSAAALMSEITSFAPRRAKDRAHS